MKNICKIFFFIFIFLILLFIILLKPVDNLDELWNYNFARNIANGLIPYKDFNIIIPPLLPIICGIFIKLVCNELILMRVLAAILCSTILYSTYQIFILLHIKREISIIYIFFIGYILKNIFCIDYNFASLLVTLLIIYREIKNYEKNNQFIKVNIKNDILLGILAGLTVALKQTSGICICIVLLGNKLLFVRNKKELKQFLKIFIFRLIGTLIPIITLLVYLFANHAVEEFINYTLKGIVRLYKYNIL